MYKLVFALIFSLSTSTVGAVECEQDANTLAAEYSFVDDRIEKTSHFVLWRFKNDLVAQEFPDKHITDMWHKVSNGALSMVRYFDDAERAIEYQPGEVKYQGGDDREWQKVYYLVPKSFKQDMRLVDTSGSGCQLVETYQLKTDNKTVEIQWMPALDLLKLQKVTTKDHSESWSMTKLITDKKLIDENYKTRDLYQSTDYADVGDNESDPFLMKMINLGYIGHGGSGFYDAEGNDISDGHHHH